MRTSLTVLFLSAPFLLPAAPKLESLSSLPLRFEPGARSGFTAQGRDYRLELRSSGIEVGPVRMKWSGGNSNPRLEGLDRLPSRTSYFVGSAAAWRSEVP